jgi:hypothetical protein
MFEAIARCLGCFCGVGGRAVLVDRKTVIVWDGIFETKGKSQSNDDGGSFDVTWHGVVVATANQPDGSKVPEPPRNAFKEFIDSDLHFQVSGTARPAKEQEEEQFKAYGDIKDGDQFKPFVVSLTSGKGWNYGGGKNHDEVHDVHVASLRWKGSPDPRDSIVVAIGRSAVEGQGPFVSVGWMRPGNRITLARRYLDEDDPRTQWTLEELRRNVLKEIYSENEGGGAAGSIVIPPWKCSAMNA